MQQMLIELGYKTWFMQSTEFRCCDLNVDSLGYPW